MTIAAAQPIYQVITGQALPDTGLFVRSGGVLLTGLNSGYTFSLRVRNPNDDATLFTKTTGFTGQIGSGSEPGGVPNLVIAWAVSGELDTLTIGEVHKARLTITRVSDSKPYIYDFLLDADS
jgi:hypothetical protein